MTTLKRAASTLVLVGCAVVMGGVVAWELIKEMRK